MRKSGVQGSSSDFSACHRNGKKHKHITRNGKTTKVPPSITVRFYSSYKKDNLLFRYKNYENNKPKKVKIVQSLNYHYHQLKGSISNQLMTVERIHPKAPVMLILIAIFTCLPSCINLSNIVFLTFVVRTT